jgi:dolichyl-phosphate beta-glucosyltransferase
MKPPELSVVIPVYNEVARVPKTLQAALNYLKSMKIPAEILIVDDGSKDQTLEAVDAFKGQATDKCDLRILKHGINRGKGAAVRTGAMDANGRIILYMDADNATPLSEFEKFKPAFQKGADVVIGSRAKDRKQVKVHQPFYREAMGRIFNLLVQAIATPGLWDTQCGFKAFSQKAARSIFPLQTIKRFGFDVELLYLAKKRDFSIEEVSVQWFDDPASKVNVLRDSTRMLLDLFVIRFNDLRGRYSGSKSRPAGPHP